MPGGLNTCILNTMPGTLYLVATPIGNLADISYRAIETLKNVDVILCEDTRHSRKLLDHYGISKKLVSYHEHNEAERAAELVAEMIKGWNVAVISDAGTPGINDPGSVIVEQAISAGIRVESIPGAAAFVSAAVVSGLPTDSIFFGGFLPSKKGERQRRLAAGQSNKRGYITFAKKGTPNSRTTQVFINYKDNAMLDSMGFTPFGEVVEGMEVVDSFYKGYGEGAPKGKGPDQMILTREGNSYLERDFPELDWLKKAVLLEG